MASESAPTTTAPSNVYTGGCHCKTIRYNITLPSPLTDPSNTVISCNCSICARNGYLLSVVKEDDIEFLKGSMKHMTKYNFNKKKFTHYFCPGCGTSCMVGMDGDTKAVNVRTFDDVDLKELHLREVDGKNYQG